MTKKFDLFDESSKDLSSIESYLKLFYQHLSKIICQPNRVGKSWVESLNKAMINLKILTENRNNYKYAQNNIIQCSMKGIDKAIKEIEKSHNIDTVALNKLKKFKFENNELDLKFVLNYRKIYEYILNNADEEYKMNILKMLDKYLKKGD